ncbi:hypothetical protein BKI52_38150 [marine bacterium AO1-C]|nr:hypothetical protein BKI52_38150 [marine bacterium AO1-C]
MPPIKALIVDDETLARDSIKVLLQKEPEFELIGEARNGTEAVQLIESLHPKLVLLDIQMPQMTGFEVLQHLQIRPLPYFIFVTAFDQFALKAFEVNALDYLLKPYSDERFYQSIHKAKAAILKDEWATLQTNLQQMIREQSPQATQSLERLAIKQGGKIKLVAVANIAYIKASGTYTEVFEAGQKHVTNYSIGALAQKLDDRKFIRIHRSTIVNVEQIAELEPYYNGEYIIYMKDGSQHKLSRSYKDQIDKIL